MYRASTATTADVGFGDEVRIAITRSPVAVRPRTVEDDQDEFELELE